MSNLVTFVAHIFQDFCREIILVISFIYLFSLFSYLVS